VAVPALAAVVTALFSAAQLMSVHLAMTLPVVHSSARLARDRTFFMSFISFLVKLTPKQAVQASDSTVIYSQATWDP
jgi:hypothetical protein